MNLYKPRSRIVVATTTLGAILDRHADHMPYKTRVLPFGEKGCCKGLACKFQVEGPNSFC